MKGKAPAKKRVRGRANAPRRDRKHDPAKLAEHEDRRRRQGEKQEYVASRLGVDSSRLRAAWRQAMKGDTSALLGVLNGRLDDHADADQAAKRRALAALAADADRDPGRWKERLNELHDQYLGEELNKRGLHPAGRATKKK